MRIIKKERCWKKREKMVILLDSSSSKRRSLNAIQESCGVKCQLSIRVHEDGCLKMKIFIRQLFLFYRIRIEACAIEWNKSPTTYKRPKGPM